MKWKLSANLFDNTMRSNQKCCHLKTNVKCMGSTYDNDLDLLR
jgi:hypothetical protein